VKPADAVLALDFLGAVVSAVVGAVRRGVHPEDVVLHLEALRPRVEKIDADVDVEASGHVR